MKREAVLLRLRKVHTSTAFLSTPHLLSLSNTIARSSWPKQAPACKEHTDRSDAAGRKAQPCLEKALFVAQFRKGLSSNRKKTESPQKMENDGGSSSTTGGESGAYCPDPRRSDLVSGMGTSTKPAASFEIPIGLRPCFAWRAPNLAKLDLKERENIRHAPVWRGPTV